MFDYPCRITMEAKHFILHTKHGIEKLKNVNKLHVNPSLFAWVRAQTDKLNP